MFFLIVIGVMIMTIYFKNKKIKTIYKGQTEIKEIFKGGELVYQKGGAVILLYSEGGEGAGISKDGLNWKKVVLPTTDTYNIKIVNNRILAIKTDGTELYETKDFINWNFIGNTSKNFSYKGFLIGNDDLFYLNGYYIHSIHDSAGWEKSTDLVNWESYTGCKTLYGGYNITSNEEDKAVYSDVGPLLGGDRSSAYTVNGGESWVVLNNSIIIGSVFYLNGLFCFNYDGYIFYSSDAINWTYTYFDDNAMLISFCNGKYFAFSTTKGWYSEDLINWTEFSIPSENSDWFTKQVCYLNGKYIYLYCDTNSVPHICFSDDGINWVQQTTNISDVGVLEGRFYIY